MNISVFSVEINTTKQIMANDEQLKIDLLNRVLFADYYLDIDQSFPSRAAIQCPGENRLHNIGLLISEIHGCSIKTIIVDSFSRHFENSGGRFNATIAVVYCVNLLDHNVLFSSRERTILCFRRLKTTLDYTHTHTHTFRLILAADCVYIAAAFRNVYALMYVNGICNGCNVLCF